MASLIDAGTRIGAVSLSVADLDRSLAYYREHIGLALQARSGADATLGAGDLPLLHLREVAGARPIRRATGLYHFALRVPTRSDLARVIRHFADAGTAVSGASDHLVSEALYLSDPDGHGIEIYRDRPRSMWYAADGKFRLDSLPLDIDDILGVLEGDQAPWSGLPAGTDMGHIHLQVADVLEAERFYVDLLGFERMIGMPSASFLGAGGYHHHIGMNTWAGVGLPPPPEGSAHLLRYEVLLPSDEALDAALGRLRGGGSSPEPADGGWLLRDPSQNALLLRR